MQGVPRSLTLIGLGSVGRRLGTRWQQSGLRVLAHSRSRESRARGRAEGLTVEDDLESAVAATDAIVLCVEDAQLVRLVERLCEVLETHRRDPDPAAAEPVCLHTSGSRDAAVLAPLAALGWATGTLHPLAAFPPDGSGPLLDGAWCVIGGDPRARETAAQLVAALGARVLALNDGPAAASTYHAAAALLSNGSVALMSIALDLAQRACRSPQEARLAMLGLLRTTIANLEQHTPERALTGPVSRADVGTIRRHLAALAGDADALTLYRALSKRMLALALRDGRLAVEAAQAVEDILTQ